MRGRGPNRYQTIAVCLILPSATLNLYPACMLSTASVQPQPRLPSPPSRPTVDGTSTLSELSLAGPTINQTTRTLFQVMYNVTGKGATQIHILPPTLSSGAGGNTLAVGRVDGSFSNKNCGAALCKPPSVSVSVARNSTLVQQRLILFNASRSVPLNPSASIISYDCMFGVGNGNVVTSLIVNYSYPVT